MMEREMVAPDVARRVDGWGWFAAKTMPREAAMRLTEEELREEMTGWPELAEAVIERLWRLGWGQRVVFDCGGGRVTLERLRENPYGLPSIEVELREEAAQ